MMTDYGGGSPTGGARVQRRRPARRSTAATCSCANGAGSNSLRLDRRTRRRHVQDREPRRLPDGRHEASSARSASRVSPDGMSLYVADWNFGGWKQNVGGRAAAEGHLHRQGRRSRTEAGVVRARRRREEVRGDDGGAGRRVAAPGASVRLVAQRRLAERGAEAVEAVSSGRGRRESPAARPLVGDLDARRDRRREGLHGRRHQAALADTDASVRRQAARQLGNRAVKDAVPELVKLLGDLDASVRFQASTALGRIGDQSAVKALLEGAHANRSVRPLRGLQRAQPDRPKPTRPRGRRSPPGWQTRCQPSVKRPRSPCVRPSTKRWSPRCATSPSNSKNGSAERVVALKLLADASRKPAGVGREMVGHAAGEVAPAGRTR